LAVYFSPPLQLQIAQFSKPNTTTFSRSRRPSTILQMIITQLDLPEIPIMICTNSFSLYECLMKFGITQEKRLIIDIMALR
jgi:hypothetical protein